VKNIGKPCAGKPQARFDRGIYSPALEVAQVKEEILPMKRRERSNTAIGSPGLPGFAARRNRFAAAVAGLLVGSAVLGAEPAAIVLLALGLVACDTGGNAADGTGGMDAIADTTGTEDADESADGTGPEDMTAAEPLAGDPEFASYCQGIVDAFRALYEGLELPDNLAQENPPPAKTGDEFDPNEFFTVLDRIHMEEGWTLDFIYTYASDMGGSPELVARRTDSPLCQSDPEQPCVTESFLLHVLVDGSREGWFQLKVLGIMGSQFYQDGHGWEGRIILPSHQGLIAWMEEQKKLGAGMYEGDGFDEAGIAELKVDPVVEVHSDRIHYNLVHYCRFSDIGISRLVADHSTEPPYSLIPDSDESEVLFECTWCGIP